MERRQVVGPGGAVAVAAPRPWRSRRALWSLLILVGVGWALGEAGLARRELLNPGGWSQLRAFLEAALRPETAAVFLRLAADAALVTLAFAVWGTALSVAFGIVGGLLGSETWWRSVLPDRGGRLRWLGGWRAPWVAVRAALSVPRAIHEIVWGLFFVAILGLDPLVGILAIAIPFGAITAKVFSEILDESAGPPLAALQESGVRSLPAVLYGLLPRAFPDLLSYAFYRFECSIRSAAVLGIIGAGGLGYQILLSLQSLRYGEMWTFLYALVLLTGLADLWSTALRRRLGSAHRIHVRLREAAGPAGAGARRPRVEAPDRLETAGRDAGAPETVGSLATAGAIETVPGRDPFLRGSLVALGFLLLFSFLYLDAGWGKLAAPRTGELLAQVLGDAFPPALGGLTLADYFRLSADTLAMSILAIALAGAGGVLFSYPGAHNFLLPGGILNPGGGSRVAALAGTAVFAATRAFLLFLRAVPAPIWALLLLFVLFPGILTGALALALYTWGVLGRLMAETTENLDARPLRALRVQGATGAGVFLYGVLPASAARYTSYLLYRWEVAIRATAMVGVVGAGGLGRLLQEQLTSFDYAAVATTMLFYVGLAFLVDLLSARVRADLR